jgi:hypothetical protein
MIDRLIDERQRERERERERERIVFQIQRGKQDGSINRIILN